MRALLRRLWFLVRRSRLEAELAEELDFHRAMKQADLQRSGLSAEDARNAASRALGPSLLAREHARAVWIVDSIETAWNDIQYACRGLRRNASFTIGVVATLAIAIGANSAIFSLVDATLLHPLRIRDGDRLVRFVTRSPGGDSQLAFTQDYGAWRDQTSLFETVSAHRLEFMNLTGIATPELVPVARVTASFFHVFPTPLVAGRTFAPDEDRPGGPQVAVLASGFWARQFGRDPNVVGRTIDVNGVPHVIVGIVPADYDSQQFDPRPDVWVPFQYDLTRRDGGDYSTVTARLRPGVTIESANAALAIAYAAAHAEAARTSSRSTWAAEPLRDAMSGAARSSMLLLFAAVALVLLVACANVANLLLARADVRQHEVAVRRALGAGRARIVRQYITECSVLSLLGGALGLGIGVLSVHGVLIAYPSANPFNAGDGASVIPAITQAGRALQLNWRVLAFTGGISVTTAVVFGLLTAMATARQPPYHALRSVNRSSGPGAHRNRFRSGIIIGEVAIALILVIGAALLLRTSFALRGVQPGFQTDHLLTMRMSVTPRRFQTSGGIAALTATAVGTLDAIPGVTAAGAGCCMPLETVWQLPFIIQGRPSNTLTQAGGLTFTGFVGWTFVSPGYFEAMGIPRLRGRAFTAADVSGTPGVVIINEAMARRFWPRGDALGAQLRIGRGMAPQFETDPVRQIIGIVGNVRDMSLNRPPRPAMYVPIAQLPDDVLAREARLLPLVWFVRTAVAPYTLGASVSSALEHASGGLPATRIRSMEDVESESTARTRFDMTLMIAFALVALLLATIGVYALITYTVRQRTHEVGIRMALGASAATVRQTIIGQGMKLVAAGVLVGIVGAIALGRLLAGFLFGVTTHDPVVFVSAASVLAMAAFVASVIPARRASRVDPIIALRAE